MNFDPTKPVQTRAGRAARVLATDLLSDLPIVAAVVTDAGSEQVYRFFPNGNFLDLRDSNAGDLVNVLPPLHEAFAPHVHALLTLGMERGNYSLERYRVEVFEEVGRMVAMVVERGAA